jgi:HEPN domain-containing protein
MLSKSEHIVHWKNQADDNLGAVDALFAAGKYAQCMFWAHLVIEKYRKAIWIKDNETNFPARTHNLSHIISQTKLTLNDEDSEFLLFMNRFSIEGRYPDYISNITDICTYEFTKINLQEINKLIKCLTENLQ